MVLALAKVGEYWESAWAQALDGKLAVLAFALARKEDTSWTGVQALPGTVACNDKAAALGQAQASAWASVQV